MALLQDNRAGPSRTSPSRTSWREASLNSPPLILSLVNEAATLAPFPELKGAASVALKILENTQAVKENKDAYVQLGEDSGGLIVAIWCSFKKTEYPREWLSTEMREILEDLTHTLKNICSFVEDHISKNKAMRIMHGRARKINDYLEHLNYAMQKFELQSQMNINDVLLQIVRKNDQLGP